MLCDTRLQRISSAQAKEQGSHPPYRCTRKRTALSDLDLCNRMCGCDFCFWGCCLGARCYESFVYLGLSVSYYLIVLAVLRLGQAVAVAPPRFSNEGFPDLAIDKELAQFWR